MSDFVRNPLLQKLNKGNFVTRIKKMEQATGIKPSESVQGLNELSPFFSGQGSVLDPDGAIFVSSVFPVQDQIQWRADDNQAILARMLGFYVPDVGSGVYLIGQEKSSTHYGVSGLAVQGETQNLGSYKMLLQLDSNSGGRLFIDNAVYSASRRSYLPGIGYLPFAMAMGADPTQTFSGSTTLAANGGAVAIPIFLTAPMMIKSVTIQNNDTATTRKWAWYLMSQSVNDNSISTPQSLATDVFCSAPQEFTPAAASLRTIEASGFPVYAGTGLYWLIIQNQSASQTFALGNATGGTLLGYTALQNTLTNPLSSPIDFSVKDWTPLSTVPGVRINGLLDYDYLIIDVPMDGTDGSTTFTDNEGSTWTANGNAQIDTSLGSAYGLFDGTGDTISTPDSSKWRLDDGMTTSQWRIDVDIRFNGDPGTGVQGFLQQRVDDNNFWAFRLQNNLLDILVRSGGSNIINATASWNPATATTYSLTVIKDGTNGYSFYVDGAQVGTTVTNQTNVIPDFAASLVFGDYFFGAVHSYFNGWARNLKIKKGSIV